MASLEDKEANVEQEREIPVFTVVKNNTILKNIFLINSGSSISETHRGNSSKISQDLEQTLLVGRHPDCDIRLEHPSISRFHLRIHSKPSSKRLSVTDLSSVHGTWISGKRIEPNIRVDVNEGDALRVGGSSRVYRLHWVPFHKAYDSSNPFVPPLDVPPRNEEKEEETKRDENAMLLENGVQSVDFYSPKDTLPNQLETSKEMAEMNTLLCENEDEKSLVSGCECSLDSALDTIKALVSSQFEASTAMQDTNIQTVDEKTVDSHSEDLGFNPNSKPSQEAEVLSEAPPPEAIKTLDMSLESRDMQFVNFAWDGSEILLLHRSPLLVEVQENKPSLAMQYDVDYSDNVVVEYEGMPVLNFKADMSISDKFEEDGEIEEKEILFSQESSITEIQGESSSGPALTSSLMENLDVTLSESIADETLPRNDMILPCDDEEIVDAWSFWSLCNQGLGGENASQVRSSLEDPNSAEIQSSLWSFWSGISEAKSVHSLPSFDGELCQVESQPNSGSLCCQSTEMLTSEPSEESFIDAEAGMLSDESYDRIERTPFSGIDKDSFDLGEGDFTPAKESYIRSTRAADGKSGTSIDKHLPSLEKSQVVVATSKACVDLEKSLSAYSNKENMTPKVIWEQSSFRHLLEEHTKSHRLKKRGMLRAPLQTLFADSPPKSISEARPSGANQSAYANMNKKNQTPKAFQEQKSAQHSSAKSVNLFAPTKGEEQRIPSQTLFADSPQNSTSKTHISSGAGLSACSNKENQTPNFLKEKESQQHSSAKRIKCLFPPKGEEQRRMPLQTLFADSPQKSTSSSLTSGGATLSSCSNKVNLPKLFEEQKSASHSSAGHSKPFLLRKQESILPAQALFQVTHATGVFARTRNPASCENSIDKNKHTKQQVKKWTMLVDNASLLDKTSRKALQLLEGIKGTQLIIPRAVVNELDVLKQQGSFFRKNTEAYLASQWIEECIARANWWIRIESSVEDGGRSTALPSSSSHSASRNLPDYVSPSIEDQVLDYALYLRRIQNDGQLVLLSDDSSMKIKAMAEGLICETAEEFRESLVNPFAKRFLWADSLPRGRTWSYLDDVIAMGKLYPGAMRTTSVARGSCVEENARGLKLILLLP